MTQMHGLMGTPNDADGWTDEVKRRDHAEWCVWMMGSATTTTMTT